MPLTVEQFTERITSSGVLSTEQLSELLAGLPADAKARSDAEALARELVKQKKLTKFQAEQIYAGKGASLSLGNYLVLDKLGEGGMGMVLKAWHRRMERTVALKVINPKVLKEQSALKRFQREVIAAAKLTHPNIVAAYDADEAKGTHFLVMEYVEGSDLSSWVKEHGPLPVEQAVNCIIQAAHGLAFAHDKGVVHRDIKPHNLLLARSDRIHAVGPDESGHYERDVVKILDMGLARIEGGFGGSAEHADLTRSGAMMGTVDYMAPEQAMDSKHADARSDIYSLGCTLFYLITGHVAFEADTVMKRLTAHQSAPPPSLAEQLRAQSSESKSGLSAVALDSGLATLDTVFQRMVAKKPEDRPQSMLQVIAELERCLTGGSATVSVASGSNPVAKPSAPTKAPANVSNRDADTIVESSSDSRTNGPSDATVVLDTSVVKNPTDGATNTSIKSQKRILISVAAIVAVLLAIAVAMSGKSPKPSDDKVVENPPNLQLSEPPPTNTELREPAEANRPPIDTALSFDGDDCVEIPSLTFDTQGSYTLEGFIALPVKADHRAGLAFGMPEQSYLSFTRLSDWRWVYQPQKRNMGVEIAISGAAARPERTHLACVRDGQTHHLFVGGKLFHKVSEKPSPATGTSPFLIGSEFRGVIDELRVSRVARYKVDFSPPTRHEPDADTLALYHFDEGRADQLVDSSGNNHHGKIVGAKWVKVNDSSAIPPALAKAPFDAAQARTHQEAWAKHLGTTVETTNSVGAKIILIPPGEFLMGTGDDQLVAALKDADDKQRGPDIANQIRNAERPRHRVVLTKPFWMGATEVTLGQYRKFVEATKYQTAAEKHPIGEKPKTYLKPGYEITDESPVSEVNFDDVVAYCRWLSEKEQATYRLPTEAEWEYSCRAGTTTAYHCGDTLLDSHEWSILNSQVKAQAVATKRPNPFGLFDMHGNLSEYCQDRFDERWYETSPSNDPLNADPGKHFYVIRGGNWDYNTILRSAYRWAITPDNHAYTIGFRVVREAGGATPAIPAKPAPSVDGDRAAATWVIEHGGSIVLKSDTTKIDKVVDLPAGKIEIRRVDLLKRLQGPDADLDVLRGLKDLEWITLDSTYATAKAVAALEQSPNLRQVSLGGFPISDAHLEALLRFQRLDGLFLAAATINTQRCPTLAKLSRLKSLNLTTNPLEDEGLELLGQLKNLRLVQLNRTKVTAAGIAKLRQALPNCDIQWDGAASSANAPMTTPDGRIDLLALFDVKRDVLAGEWSREANGLKVKQSETTIYVPRLQWPYQPPEEYDYEIEFTQGNGNGTVEQLLSAQSRSFAWVLNNVLKDGVKAGFDTLDGMNLVNRKDASVMRPKLLEPGRRYRSRVEVRKGKLRAFLDDELLVEWGGDFQRLDIIPSNALRDKLHLGLAANDRGALFHKVTVREVSGAGKLTSGVAGSEANSAWIDWLGPRLKQGNFFDQFDGRQGWQREGDAITTNNVISGQQVVSGKTRDGAVRLTYLLRDAKGIVINACDRSVNGKRELYVAEDQGTQLLIALVQAGAYKNLIQQPIPASIPKDAQRTLEFRIAGDTLTATFNGSVVATVKDTTLTEGNFALVALKGVLVQKVEYQRLDQPTEKESSQSPSPPK